VRFKDTNPVPQIEKKYLYQLGQSARPLVFARDQRFLCLVLVPCSFDPSFTPGSVGKTLRGVNYRIFLERRWMSGPQIKLTPVHAGSVMRIHLRQGFRSFPVKRN
jgi:hypothetical protein